MLRELSSFTSPSYIILRSQSTSASSRSETGGMVEVDYEWLKQSRPIRIHARAVGSGTSSSGVTKRVHFQRHGQGKLEHV
jgi:hypothetical protein